MLTPKIEKIIMDNVVDLLYFFGYTKYEEGRDSMDLNLDGIFKAEEIPYFGFKKLNEAIMKEMLEKDNTFKDKSLLINDPTVEDPRKKLGLVLDKYINENIKVDMVHSS